ncbi:alpha/beta hydrolase family protein [Cyclobacterium xiamenense]|uniref:alpha/beta hydrolase family protein n=1 Tax=Cyclobacterium xiamenense TaxID=1297121 RepID=UPI0035CFF433
MLVKTTLSFVFVAVACLPGIAQNDAYNYEESKVHPISLPDPFVSLRGEAIETIRDWEYLRRGEIVSLFENEVYGQVPGDMDAIRFELASEDKLAMNGTAHLKEIDILVERKGRTIRLRLILFVPTAVTGPAPVFLLINHRDPENIDPSRQVRTGFWPAEAIIERGYAAATFHVKDVSDDNNDTFKADILNTLYPEQLEMENGMRGLGAWAWGAMRAMDYLITDGQIDVRKAAVVGHSRGGKAALWTGAQDTRWAITVSNESGCGGAALSRRRFGETVKRINTSFPYWFTDNFNRYNDQEDLLPVDQHLLVAAIAPRAVYVASASEDQWADPKGEFLSLRLGTRVHREIYKMDGSFPASLPAPESPLHLPYAGHHIRDGKHNLTPYDWERFMDFADQLFGK